MTGLPVTLRVVLSKRYKSRGPSWIPGSDARRLRIWLCTRRIQFNEGYYYDRNHRRHAYRYPRDYGRYGYSRSWYRTHPNWYRDRSWRGWR